MGETESVSAQLDDLQREIDGIELENQVFEEYLKFREASGTAHTPEMRSQSARSRASRQKVPQKLTMLQKCEIATVGFERKQEEMEELKQSSDKLIDTLKAVLEETELRIAELKKDAFEFKRDVVVGAENMRTGKTMAEKVQKYMEDKLKSRDGTIEKMKLKNVTIKGHIAKLEGQLKQKEEMGDVLHYIDFHQLQIENKQYVAKIEEKNEELIKLKLTTGATVQTLNAEKETLSALLHEQEVLMKDTENRRVLLKKVRQDNITVGQEIAADRKMKKKLSQQQTDTSNMPQVLDYVNQKAEMYELDSAIKNWERKVEIMEMAAKRARMLQKLNRQTAQLAI